MLTLEQAAEQLRINRKTVRRLIEKKILPATQIVPGAPWELSMVLDASSGLQGLE